jgi:hypothetical protein
LWGTLAERITGHSIEKTYYPEAQIESVLAGNPDPEQLFFHQFMKLIVDGAFDFEGTLNAQLPSIKTVTAEEYLTEYWGSE